MGESCFLGGWIRVVLADNDLVVFSSESKLEEMSDLSESRYQESRSCQELWS